MFKETLKKWFHENPWMLRLVDKQRSKTCGQPVLIRKKVGVVDDTRQGDLQPTVDIVAFSYHRPLQLHAFLESLFLHVSGLNEVSVIYRADQDSFQKGYEALQRHFPSVHFFKQQGAQEFKPLVLNTLQGEKNFVAFAVDDIIVKEAVDGALAAKSLNQTGAYGFYLRLGKNITSCYMLNKSHALPPMVSLGEDLLAWQFATAPESDWSYPNTVDMTIYRKEDIRKVFETFDFIHPNSLEGKWATKGVGNACGLCFKHSKIVNLPLNLVNPSTNRHMGFLTPEELLERYRAGERIDLSPFATLAHTAPHADYVPSFIQKLEV